MRKIALLTVLFAFLCSCNYTKPGMYISFTNSSGVTLRNVEIDYPGGIYGLNTLANDQTNRRLVQVTPPCTFVVKFDVENKPATEPHKFELGETCPKEVLFTVDPALTVSRRIVER